MAIITCDIRRGRTNEQKSALATGLMGVISRTTGESIESMFLVMREMPGFNFVDAGQHVADYVSGTDGKDVAGAAQLHERGIEA